MASADSGVDMELKKAFQELQTKLIETNQKIKLADVQIESLKRVVQHSNLTHKEIFSLPEKTPMYKQLGRCFMLASSNEIDSMLQQRVKSAEAKVEELESNKQWLERSLKDSEANLRELIVQKQKGR